MATSHIASLSEDEAVGALDPGRVVDLLAPQVAVALAVYKTLSDPFIARRLVDERRYGGELLSSVRGFVEGGAMLASTDQRAEIALRGSDLFARLTESSSGLACLDLIASATGNWATAMAGQNTQLAEESRRAVALMAKQIPMLAEKTFEQASS
ncbi:hypothetical protein [Brevundimonas sp.]|uniref:hypothetical protein n=1 Tax=Brevundimonas sp. TaxID=1871086 RepID=UPI002FC88A89